MRPASFPGRRIEGLRKGRRGVRCPGRWGNPRRGKSHRLRTRIGRSGRTSVLVFDEGASEHGRRGCVVAHRVPVGKKIAASVASGGPESAVARWGGRHRRGSYWTHIEHFSGRSAPRRMFFGCARFIWRTRNDRPGCDPWRGAFPTMHVSMVDEAIFEKPPCGSGLSGLYDNRENCIWTYGRPFT